MKKKMCLYKSKKLWWKTSLDTGWPTNETVRSSFKLLGLCFIQIIIFNLLDSSSSLFFFLLYQEHASNLVENFFIL